jgi:hypothetical protein
MVLANASVPMLGIEWIGMLLALVPVIIVEALVYRHRLKMETRRAFAGATSGNLVSTLFGVPLAWLASFLLSIAGGVIGVGDLRGPLGQIANVILNPAWLFPDERNLYWMIPLAALTLLVPTYFASVLIEGAVCRLVWPQTDRGAVWRATWLANLASYGLLFAVAAVWLVAAINRG